MLCGLLSLASLSSISVAQDKKIEPPRIAVAVPFAIPAKSTSKVIVRGWMLDRDLLAKTSTAGVTMKILRHEKAPIPNGQDAKLIGDSQLELEISLPPDFAADMLSITLLAGDSESAPYSLAVRGPYPQVAEIEPNDGFRQAQALKLPQIVDGQIHADRNVDVYSVELPSRHRLLAEVIARRYGSGLDSVLSVFDAKGQKITSNDDFEGVDSKLDIMLEAGRYFLVIQDAHDHGGPAHPYRLSVSVH